MSSINQPSWFPSFYEFSRVPQVYQFPPFPPPPDKLEFNIHSSDMQTVICSRFVAMFLYLTSLVFLGSPSLPVFLGPHCLPVFLDSPSLPVLLGSTDKLQFHTHFNDMQTGICSRFAAVFPSSNQISWVPPNYQFSWVPPDKF